MKEYFKVGSVLLLVVAISCSILAYVNTITEPLIEENNKKAAERAMQSVLPEATSFIERDFYFEAVRYGEIIGYVIQTNATGYSGEIRTMVGLDLDLSVKNIFVLQQTETPGLGNKITGLNFTNQFKNLFKEEIRKFREGGRIVSISGATISSSAVANSVRESIERLENELKSMEEIDGSMEQSD